MRYLIKAFLLLFFTMPLLYPIKALANDNTYSKSTTLQEESFVRFTSGWSILYYKKWRINMLELVFKYPKQKSIFKISIGGSKSKKFDYSMVSGDLDAEIIPDFLSIELPQEYNLSKRVKRQLWAADLAYEYYWSLFEGNWWKMKWDFYLSAGILGRFEALIEKKKYSWKIVIEEDQVIEDSLKLPGGSVNDSFSFHLPFCVNTDIELLSVRTCGFFSLKKPRNSSVQGSFSFGF